MEFILRCVLYLCSFNILTLNAFKICKIPNGDAGTCIRINKCQPLHDIYNKRSANVTERLFLQQSICSDSDSPMVKVCCPDQSTFSEFRVNPVLFPNTYIPSPKDPNSNKIIPEKPTDEKIMPVLLTIPNDDLNSRSLENYKMKIQCGKHVGTENKITGGEVAGIDQYPWLAILEYPNNLNPDTTYSDLCGGSLITSRFVLTAAHCLVGQQGKPVYVRLAEYDKTTSPVDSVETDGGGIEYITEQRIPVDSTYKYPSFRRIEMLDDIGLVKMKSDVMFTEFIRPICLPQVDYVPSFDKTSNFTLAGWGTDNGVDIKIKMHVVVPYVTPEQCRPTKDTLTDKQICAGGQNGKDSCKGDSGGPLMFEKKNTYYVTGVVSYGDKHCGKEGKPAVYTHVYKYRDWIDKVLSGEN